MAVLPEFQQMDVFSLPHVCSHVSVLLLMATLLLANAADGLMERLPVVDKNP